VNIRVEIIVVRRRVHRVGHTAIGTEIEMIVVTTKADEAVAAIITETNQETVPGIVHATNREIVLVLVTTNINEGNTLKHTFKNIQY
jgi:hypothetical protein